MFRLLGIVVAVFFVAADVWVFSCAAGLRRVRGLTLVAVLYLAVAAWLFALGPATTATLYLALAAVMVALGAWLVRRLRPPAYAGPVGLYPNGPLAIQGSKPPRPWHAYEADLDPPGRPVRRRRSPGH